MSYLGRIATRVSAASAMPTLGSRPLPSMFISSPLVHADQRLGMPELSALAATNENSGPSAPRVEIAQGTPRALYPESSMPSVATRVDEPRAAVDARSSEPTASRANVAQVQANRIEPSGRTEASPSLVEVPALAVSAPPAPVFSQPAERAPTEPATLVTAPAVRTSDALRAAGEVPAVVRSAIAQLDSWLNEGTQTSPMAANSRLSQAHSAAAGSETTSPSATVAAHSAHSAMPIPSTQPGLPSYERMASSEPQAARAEPLPLRVEPDVAAQPPLISIGKIEVEVVSSAAPVLAPSARAARAPAAYTPRGASGFDAPRGFGWRQR